MQWKYLIEFNQVHNKLNKLVIARNFKNRIEGAYKKEWTHPVINEEILKSFPWDQEKERMLAITTAVHHFTLGPGQYS